MYVEEESAVYLMCRSRTWGIRYFKSQAQARYLSLQFRKWEERRNDSSRTVEVMTVESRGRVWTWARWTAYHSISRCFVLNESHFTNVPLWITSAVGKVWSFRIFWNVEQPGKKKKRPDQLTPRNTRADLVLQLSSWSLSVFQAGIFWQ